MPSSAIKAVDSLTVASGPALAVGASFTLFETVMSTVSAVLLSVPSFTTSEKVSVSCSVTSGEVNVGCEAVSSDSVTVVPAV